MKKICPKCNKEFECKHSQECFCMKYSIPEEALNRLKKEFDNCLCEDCLKEYATKKRLTPKHYNTLYDTKTFDFYHK